MTDLAAIAAELRPLAEAAKASFPERYWWYDPHGATLDPIDRPDAAYIAAASPDRILALLDHAAAAAKHDADVLARALTVERIAEALLSLDDVADTDRIWRAMPLDRLAAALRAALLNETEAGR